MSELLAGQGVDTTGDFSVDWLVYHATYTGDYLAALDLETGREFTYRELDSAVFLSEKLDGALERRQSSSS